MEKKLNLNNITSISEISESYSHSGQDYVFSHIVFDNTLGTGKKYPVRFEGLTVVVVVSGTIEISIGASNYKMNSGSVTVIGPNDVISAANTADGKIDLYTLFLSNDFLSGLNIDVSIISPRYIINSEAVMQMSTTDTTLVCAYLNLLHQCALNNADAPQQLSMISRSIGRNIVVSLLYQLVFMNEKAHLLSTTMQGDKAPIVRSRKVNYVHEFMQLLQQHYRKERTVSFYAGQLCISPKYLSLLVREVTGRTAAAIIDQYVINEAKNMLRFSGYTIQQVAYKLNFPNQSAFGKYFKHITGQSPTSFRSN